MLAAAAKFVDGLAPDDRIALWTSTQTSSTILFSESRDAIKQRIRAAVGTYRAPFGPWNIGRDEAITADVQSGNGVFTVVGRTDRPPPSRCR